MYLFAPAAKEKNWLCIKQGKPVFFQIDNDYLMREAHRVLSVYEERNKGTTY